ncbi:MAG: transcriptional activator NhaR [Phycisphaerales bacterium]
MERLNYHHLLYFWTVAKEGSIAAACKRLHVTQPTISGQLRELQTALGHELLTRSGRGLVLTEHGRLTFRYADDIFALGGELLSAVRAQHRPAESRLRVGVADVLTKLVVYRMLLPVLRMPERVRLVCFEGKHDHLLARLAVHDLDVVLSDTPVSPHAGIRGYSHRLGESGLSVFGAPALARRYRAGFPGSLDGAPFLLPTPNTAIRRTLDHYFESRAIRPRTCGEFEDSALLKIFGQSGAGLFVGPTFIEREIRQQYSVRVVGRLSGAREEFYAISMERRIKHPAVTVLTTAVRRRLTVDA